MRKKLRLLLDENIGKSVAKHFRRENYDVLSIAESDYLGLSDEGILSIALAEKRILVTLDKDFGYMIFLNSLKHSGVILLRLHNESPNNLIKVLDQLLVSLKENEFGKFVVASEKGFRIR